MKNTKTKGFHLEVNSLQEFTDLCAIIRGEKLDDATLSGLIAKLGGATKTFEDAEKAAEKKI
jgi:hypothetical protein